MADRILWKWNETDASQFTRLSGDAILSVSTYPGMPWMMALNLSCSTPGTRTIWRINDFSPGSKLSWRMSAMFTVAGATAGQPLAGILPVIGQQNTEEVGSRIPFIAVYSNDATNKLLYGDDQGHATANFVFTSRGDYNSTGAGGKVRMCAQVRRDLNSVDNHFTPNKPVMIRIEEPAFAVDYGNDSGVMYVNFSGNAVNTGALRKVNCFSALHESGSLLLGSKIIGSGLVFNAAEVAGVSGSLPVTNLFISSVPYDFDR